MIKDIGKQGLVLTLTYSITPRHLMRTNGLELRLEPE